VPLVSEASPELEIKKRWSLSGIELLLACRRASRSTMRFAAVLLLWLQCANASKAAVDASHCSEKRRREAAYLGKVSLAGAISCSVTHTLVVPLDVIKTKLQMNPQLAGPRQAIRTVIAGADPPFRARAFLHGSRATAAGYFLQGTFKFGASTKALPLLAA
jgi:hypothetical protein